MIGILLLAIIIALGVASAMGWTTDSRDPRFGVGPVLRPERHSTPDACDETAKAPVRGSGEQRVVDRREIDLALELGAVELRVEAARS
jgi:hypothetical protein